MDHIDDTSPTGEHRFEKETCCAKSVNKIIEELDSLWPAWDLFDEIQEIIKKYKT